MPPPIGTACPLITQTVAHDGGASVKRRGDSPAQGLPVLAPLCRRRGGAGALSRLAPAPPALLVAGVRTRPTTTRDAPTAPRSPARTTRGLGTPRPLPPASGHHSAPGTPTVIVGQDDAR